jgi:hypothetical protein
MDFSSLVGKTLVSVKVSGDKERIDFEDSEGSKYVMWHHQDCCESVSVESIVGDLEDLIAEPILRAEEAVSDQDINPPDVEVPEYQESFTWTFYKLATRKGYVDIRWYGSSNGCYSERVDFEKVG